MAGSTKESFENLESFVDALRREGELVEVEAGPEIVKGNEPHRGLIAVTPAGHDTCHGAEQDDSTEVKKTLAVLERLAPPNVGLVLNRVRVRGKLDEVQGAIREPPNWS